MTRPRLPHPPRHVISLGRGVTDGARGRTLSGMKTHTCPPTPRFAPLGSNLTKTRHPRRPPAGERDRRWMILWAGTWYLISVLAGLGVLLAAGCSLNRGDRHGTAEAYDLVSRADRGHPTAAPFVRERYRLTSSLTEPPTVRQRVSAIVGSVGGIGVVIVILMAVFTPGILAGFAVRAAAKWRAAFRQTVNGLTQARTVARDVETHDALAATQDATTKKLVGQVKHE